MVAGACGGCNGCGRSDHGKAAYPCTQSVPQARQPAVSEQGRSMVGMDVVELAPLPGLHHADFTAAKLTHALMGFAQRAGLPRKA